MAPSRSLLVTFSLIGLASCAAPSSPSVAACHADTDCPAPADPCREARCRRGACADEPRPAGTLLTDASPGDCRRPICGENGEQRSLRDPLDLPAPGADPCRRPACSDGAPGTEGSALYGCRPVVFVHDEIIVEAPEEYAHEAAVETDRVMCEAMQEVTPHVPARASPALMRNWSKKADAVFDADGRYIAWEDRPKQEKAA